MIVKWTIVYDTCNNINPKHNCTEVHIFFNTYLSPSDPRYDNGPYNNITVDPFIISHGQLGPILHTIHTALTISTVDFYSLSAYPYDIYYVRIFVFAWDISTHTPVHLLLKEFVGVITGIHTLTTVISPLYHHGHSISNSTQIIATLQRSTLVIVYCVIITITFWMVTLMICLIMIATVFFRFRQRNEIVVVPIGTVFAFTQLRASMPGAPEGFGDTLDIVGLLPCLILLSICAISMVGVYLFADPDDPTRKVLTWIELSVFSLINCVYNS
ncbi:hypothetical protein IW261DRAFT_1575742 [Armillaria novae-zelandiae]|uniref:Uncharacterized protein n=1 Tax=Armillaria novae-zelandiae TaxID=153914 RepID=A0AA39ND30_9AGAR|nr:hypothetical protein IW261DRAFT_1575742 [Armillaria novae-zelandiae]